MKPSLLTSAIETCIQIQQPAFIWGAPGICKSAIVRQTADRMGLDLIDVRAVLLDPVDLRGLPHVNGDNRAHWAIPDFLPRDGAGVLFLDELNRAPQLVQNACLQLTLDRRIGEYRLPDGWSVLAAGNPDGVGVQRMDGALSSRFVHFDCEPDLEDWCKWAIGANICPETIAFLRSFPHLLHAQEKGQRSFPCPRTWEFCSRITATMPNADIAHDLYAGAVGSAAIEYTAFLRLFASMAGLVDAIMLDPATARIPDDPSGLFAVSAALARRCTDKNIPAVTKYLDRLPAQEYAVYAIQDAVRRDETLRTTKSFTRWAIAHADVIF